MRQSFYALTVLSLAGWLHAAPVTYNFSGTTQSAMTVNNGTNIGTVPAGTPFSGSFTFDNAQPVNAVAFSGGSHGTYSFSSMSLTVNGGTVSWGPGAINVYYHLTSNTSGYPIGDSLYVNIPGSTGGAIPPGGLINGAAFNWIFLGFVDNTGTAFQSAALPSNLNFASFQSRFIEFNYGTTGTPFGAGNTSTIQPLSTLVNTSAVPPTITTTSLPGGTYGVPYTAAIGATGPNPVTLSVSGLPTGLTFNGAQITGTPGAVGTSNVTISAVDSVTKLSTSTTLPLVINDAAISFAPTLAAGVANAPYSSTFAPATGGTGSFTYSALGLPAGLTLTGNTVSGTTGAGTVTVTLTATDTAGSAVSVPVTLTINPAVAVPCSGSRGVVSAYVARNPGYIVVNGGLNLLDHLWTSNLNSTNTTFLGGLVNWYQTGLIVNWSGYVDTAGCILNTLTVAPAVTITTTSLPGGMAGVPYSAPLTVAWGVAPYSLNVSGLPSGLTYSNGNISGTPGAVGSFTVTVTAVDALGASISKALSLTTVAPAIGFAPSLPAGTSGTPYTATLSATGFGPFRFTATGLPSGLTLSGSTITGTPATAGAYSVALTATDASGASAAATVTLTINPAASSNYTSQDEGKGKITAIAPDYTCLMVGSKKLIWNSATTIQVNTNSVDLHVVNSFVQVGMVVQWKGLRDKTTNTVLTNRLEIN